ncbi:hypothetical protein Tco_0568600 [Tanacetum coccineum]
MSNTNTNLLLNHMVFFTTDTVILCSTSKVQEKTQLSKERCMQSLRAIQSQFKFLTDTLQDFGTMPIFKRTFAQDLDLLEQHLTKEIISQTDCKTILTKLRTTFENAFNSEFKERVQKILDLCQMTEKYFVEYIGTEYDIRVNKRQMQMQESKIDTGKAVDDDLVVIESSGTESEVQDDNSRPGNDIDADDADIRPIYNEEPIAEVQLTAECNIFAIGEQHTKQPKIINKGRVDQYPEQRQVKSRIFKSVGLRWIPTGKLFDSCTSKDDSEPTHGSNVDIPNIHESKQTLDLSAGSSINVQKEQGFDLSADMIELESLFGPLFDEYFNGENQVVSKSSAVTTADASDKRQQQPDSASSSNDCHS